MANLTLAQFKKCHSVLNRLDRITDGIIHALAWLFVIGVVGILVLAVTGLARLWALDLAQFGKHIANASGGSASSCARESKRGSHNDAA